MNNNIFIPKKINVGFQNRNSTYTGKLAYVVYFDEKGILRKEKSWNSWRDSKIQNQIFDNVPTEGFVLNKKVGGYSSGWNHRQTYTRIYDPRGFEFEITVENLLYILENTSSIKGKGLEGDFIYGWNGADLILIPTSSPDYIELSKFNELRHECKKYNGKDLILGATYKNKDNRDLIYLGKFYQNNDDNKESKTYFFYDENSKYGNIIPIKSLSNNIIDIVDKNCAEEYSTFMDKLLKSSYYSERDPSKDVYTDYTYEEFKQSIKDRYYGKSCFILSDDGKYKKYEIKRNRFDYYNYYNSNDYYYDVYTMLRGCKDERILEKMKLETIYDKIKPKYLVSYKSNGELIKEWK